MEGRKWPYVTGDGEVISAAANATGASRAPAKSDGSDPAIRHPSRSTPACPHPLGSGPLGPRSRRTTALLLNMLNHLPTRGSRRGVHHRGAALVAVAVAATAAGTRGITAIGS